MHILFYKIMGTQIKIWMNKIIQSISHQKIDRKIGSSE